MKLQPPPPKNAGTFRQYPVQQILGVDVPYLTREMVLDICRKMMTADHPAHLITINSLMLLESQRDPNFRQLISQADFLVPDSWGLNWASKKMYKRDLPIFPGIDLAEALCELSQAMKTPVFFLGGKPGVAEKAAAHIQSLYPNVRVGGLRDGYFNSSDEELLLRELHASGARLFLVAMGQPKQEEWIQKYKSLLPPGLFIGVGGTFDVWAGNVKRAPLSLRKHGMEWLYRLLQEPYRWSRIAQLPLFAWRVLRQKQRDKF